MGFGKFTDKNFWPRDATVLCLAECLLVAHAGHDLVDAQEHRSALDGGPHDLAKHGE